VRISIRHDLHTKLRLAGQRERGALGGIVRSPGGDLRTEGTINLHHARERARHRV
jgi:hypothetical protein